MGKKVVEIGAVELRKLREKLERENVKKAAKKSRREFDGFGPFIQDKYSRALRKVWRDSSTSRKLCVKRADVGGGYSKCETCGRKVPKIYVDHIKPCGKLTDPGYLERLSCPSNQLQALCHDCHKKKTAKDKESFF